MDKFYLIGMPGCGKSTIGKAVAKDLKTDFVDLDVYIEQKTQKSIDTLFENGEEYFRKIETECLIEISQRSNCIVATGGGIVTKSENSDIMKSSGKVIFIDASPQSILDKCPLEGRPLLKDKNKIYDLYGKRISLYRKAADVIVENDGFLSEICAKVTQIITNGT